MRAKLKNPLLVLSQNICLPFPYNQQSPVATPNHSPHNLCQTRFQARTQGFAGGGGGGGCMKNEAPTAPTLGAAGGETMPSS